MSKPRVVFANYTRPMRSVADQLREDTRARVLALPLMARIATALQLGDDDVALYAAHAGVGVDEARRRLCTQRAHGRRSSQSARPADANASPRPGR
jgi:hypothetical protein